MSNFCRGNHEIEVLAHDLARDVREMKYEEIIIYAEGNENSMSEAQFEILKERLALLAPGIRVVYRPTNTRRPDR